MDNHRIIYFGQVESISGVLQAYRYDLAEQAQTRSVIIS